MSKGIKPTASELAILKTVWQEAPLSAKEIHEQVEEELQWSFSSTRKTLERMEEKKFLVSRKVHGVKVFAPKLNKLRTLAAYAHDFAKNILELDGPLPASMFADSKLLNRKDVKALEKLLEDMEKEK